MQNLPIPLHLCRQIATQVYWRLALALLLFTAVVAVAPAAAALAAPAQVTTDGTLPVPVTITPPAGSAGDEFGNAAALQGDLLVVGAWRTTVAGHAQQGAAYVYGRDGSNSTHFSMIKQLTASDGVAFDGFGAAVAVDGDTVVVGAVYADPAGNTNEGAAYVFERNQGGANNWGEVIKLRSSDMRKLGNFGATLAIHGDLIAAAAPVAHGAVFVFNRNQGGTEKWGEIQRLTNPNPLSDPSDSFGSALALDDKTLVVGAALGDLNRVENPTPNNNEGAVFIYDKHVNDREAAATLYASDHSFNARFGSSVALDGDQVFVGAPATKANGLYSVGTVYGYQRDAGGQANGAKWPNCRRPTAAHKTTLAAPCSCPATLYLSARTTGSTAPSIFSTTRSAHKPSVISKTGSTATALAPAIRQSAAGLARPLPATATPLPSRPAAITPAAAHSTPIHSTPYRPLSQTIPAATTIRPACARPICL